MKPTFLLLILISLNLRAQENFNFSARLVSPRTEEKERCIELVSNYGEPPVSMKPWTFTVTEWIEPKEAPKPDPAYIWVTYGDLPGPRRTKAILTIEESKELAKKLNDEAARLK